MAHRIKGNAHRQFNFKSISEARADWCVTMHNNLGSSRNIKTWTRLLRYTSSVNGSKHRCVECMDCMACRTRVARPAAVGSNRGFSCSPPPGLYDTEVVFSPSKFWGRGKQDFSIQLKRVSPYCFRLTGQIQFEEHIHEDSAVLRLNTLSKYVRKT